MDNQTVTLGSNFVGMGTEDTVERWNKKEKEFMQIMHPEVVKLYNSCIGGVDVRSTSWTLQNIPKIKTMDIEDDISRS